MLAKIDKALSVLVKLAALILLCTLTFVTYKVYRSNLSDTSKQLNASLVTFNDPKFGLHQILRETTGITRQSRELVDVALNTAHVQEKNVNKTANQLNEAGTKINSILARTDAVVDKLDTSAGTFNKTLKDLDEQVVSVGNQTTNTMKSAQDLVADPNIKRTLNNVADISDNMEDITENADNVSLDFADKFHAITHPPKEPWYKQVKGDIPLAIKAFVALHSFGAY